MENFNTYALSLTIAFEKSFKPSGKVTRASTVT
jgi:hypothetical protein